MINLADRNTAQMKDFIGIMDVLVEQYSMALNPSYVSKEPLVEDTVQAVEHPIISECRDLVFKLRAFMESESNQDYALGVETGMQQAATMVENIIKRYEKGDDFGRES